MPLEQAAPPLSDRELVAVLFQAVVRAVRHDVTTWDDLKTLLTNGAALALQEEAARAGASLAEVADRMQVDVTTLRRNLPPPPRPEAVESELAREIYRVVDREGRATMAEVEALVDGCAAAQRARRGRPRVHVADVVLSLCDEGYLARIERDRLPTQYALSPDKPVLQQMGQSRDDWMRGIAYALTLAFDTALRQARAINAPEFNQRLRRAQRDGESLPVPERDRTPWFFVHRPSALTEHEVNERFAAAVRAVIESLDRERPDGDKGSLMHLALALNHSLGEET